MIFVNIDLLLILIWQSIKEKTFKCDLFENKFYDYSDLVGVHAGEKPYKCSVCVIKYFLNIVSLQIRTLFIQV